ncbi:DUF1173 family protein [Buttiauxella warmboldiae]|uniref:DUF1173 family protein n=1 Tax=Buttiauxella warmboldiae TaxID=82993 RepID=A0A3N5DPX9_9ENTR|nr:DUF1173 family protein [Buttiauxella warmboldiae]
MLLDAILKQSLLFSGDPNSVKLLKDTKSIATCGCDPSQKLRLYVHTAHTSGLLSLRRFPHTGPAHALTCKYYCRVNKDGGVGTYSSDAISRGSAERRMQKAGIPAIMI